MCHGSAHAERSRDHSLQVANAGVEIGRRRLGRHRALITAPVHPRVAYRQRVNGSNRPIYLPFLQRLAVRVKVPSGVYRSILVKTGWQPGCQRDRFYRLSAVAIDFKTAIRLSSET